MNISKSVESENLLKLEPVHGSSYCKCSVIENKLEILYKNQVKIGNELVMLKKMLKELGFILMAK